MGECVLCMRAILYENGVENFEERFMSTVKLIIQASTSFKQGHTKARAPLGLVHKYRLNFAQK